ncbi:MAG: replication protein C [Proteobacteria bacterium]|nr:replication protein C [Pseudomonadota bacterium]
MTQESALEAPGERRAGVPTGFRRLTQSLLQVDRAAESFDGLPDGVTAPGQLLAALKAAAPHLGLSPRLIHAVDWLFRFTQPQDWGRGGRPIVWPSASMQQEALGLSPTQVKAINRGLIEAGLVTMRDSPNGKRYGKRDPKGRIVEAYGFDLAPIAARHAEFMRVAREAATERAEMGRLRRRATIARNGITQILETAGEYGFQGDEWTRLAQDSRQLTGALRQVERPEEMALGVASLERRQRSARERLENLLAQLAPNVPEAVDSDPKGPENRPHQYTYNLSLHPQEDTVIASEESSKAGREASTQSPAPGRRQLPERGRVLKLAPDELVRLAPRLKPYLRCSDPTWPDVVDAADWLRHDLDVSKPLWGEACLAMGREQAAIALAVVSTKDPAHFRTTAGGYFYGMVTKAKAGQLNLDRTLWALRRASELRPQRKAASGGEGAAR